MSASAQNAADEAGVVEAGVAPPDTRIYAIGDIHGCVDLLTALHAHIRKDFAASGRTRAVEVFLGDYIDRGPASRQVIDWVIGSAPVGGERICLSGNHEDMLLRAFDDLLAMESWLHNGGVETLRSYGVSTEKWNRDAVLEARRALVSALPRSHREFIAGLPRWAAIGGYLFVHAGLHPDRPLDAQDPHDLVWMREPFLSSDADFGRLVVHGHTPCEEPEVRANRINIDTGAVFGGPLTCLVLDGSDRFFMQAARPA